MPFMVLIKTKSFYHQSSTRTQATSVYLLRIPLSVASAKQSYGMLSIDNT